MVFEPNSGCFQLPQSAVFHASSVLGIPNGIPKTLGIWVRGYPKHGDTQITVTPHLEYVRRRKVLGSLGLILSLLVPDPSIILRNRQGINLSPASQSIFLSKSYTVKFEILAFLLSFFLPLSDYVKESKE